MMTRHFAPFVAGVALVAAAACSHGDSGPRTPLGKAASVPASNTAGAAHALIGPAALATLDTGNALFRKKDYAGALAKYRAAADLAPQHAAPLFGIYMVAKEQKNTALADSALAEIRKRNGPLAGAPHEMSDSALKALHESMGLKAGKGAKGT
ncbi:MAG TPA: hypothetical protein VG916_03560 [Gemmatimonadaceae bacterium]|nr:hypothetical protein [Gemmatimonadaceae bacterium]